MGTCPREVMMCSVQDNHVTTRAINMARSKELRADQGPQQILETMRQEEWMLAEAADDVRIFKSCMRWSTWVEGVACAEFQVVPAPLRCRRGTAGLLFLLSSWL